MSEKFSVDGVHMHLENKKISKNFFWMLWVMYAVVYMTKSCYSAAMASIVAEGILTKSQTGLINAVFYGVYAPFQILGGVFADKYNPEKMIKIGLVAAVVPMWQYNFMVSAVSLFLLAVMFHFVCNHVAKYMVPDDSRGSRKDKLPLRQSDKT